MMYSDEAVKKLGIRVGCDSLKEKLKACSPYICTTKLSVFGMDFYNDALIFGVNTLNQCVFSSQFGKQYFIPKEDLENFIEVFFAQTKTADQHSRADLSGASITEIKYEKILNGQSCKYSVEIEMKTDISQNITKTIYNKIEVDPKSPAICKQKKITLLEELQKKGLVVEFQPEKIGIQQQDFGQPQVIVPTQPIVKNSPTTQVAQSPLTLAINGKTDESLNLGDKYELQISGILPNSKIVGVCDGAPRCNDWFLGGLKFMKADANGYIRIHGALAPNWNIPLVKYTFWVTTGGQTKSNQISLTLNPKK